MKNKLALTTVLMMILLIGYSQKVELDTGIIIDYKQNYYFLSSNIDTSVGITENTLNVNDTIGKILILSEDEKSIFLNSSHPIPIYNCNGIEKENILYVSASFVVVEQLKRKECYGNKIDNLNTGLNYSFCISNKNIYSSCFYSVNNVSYLNLPLREEDIMPYYFIGFETDKEFSREFTSLDTLVSSLPLKNPKEIILYYNTEKYSVDEMVKLIIKVVNYKNHKYKIESIRILNKNNFLNEQKVFFLFIKEYSGFIEEQKNELRYFEREERKINNSDILIGFRGR